MRNTDNLENHMVLPERAPTRPPLDEDDEYERRRQREIDDAQEANA